ncbi:MAG TPA: biopolymer transporter ExbD, partial [Kofleriaceae bacterium]|nr:biopolymer transporter ExbD [Kofleriaceae bacterium]
NTGVEVDLPETNTQPVKDPKGKPTLSITKQYELFIGGEKIAWNKLAENLKARGEMPELQIEADKDLPYGVVVTAMAVAQEAGVGKLQLLSDPTAQLDLGSLDSGKLAPSPAAGEPPAAGAQPAAGGAR